MFIVRKIHIISTLLLLFEQRQHIDRNLNQYIIHLVHRRQFAFHFLIRVRMKREQITVGCLHFILRVGQLFFRIGICNFFEKRSSSVF